MKVIFTKDGEERVFEIRELRYSGYLIIMDIVNEGWRSITKDQYDQFTVVENNSENS